MTQASTSPARRPAAGADSGLDVGGYVRLVRRVRDLSQRDLAMVLGVGQPTIAGWETGRTCPDLATMQAVLSLGGMRLAVVRVPLTPRDESDDGSAHPELHPLDGHRSGAWVWVDTDGLRGTVTVAHAAVRVEVGPEPAAGPGVEPDGEAPEGHHPGAVPDVAPLRRESVRDRGGRRLPAHLDVRLRTIAESRWDRCNSDTIAPMRTRRDSARFRYGRAPVDHPTRADVRAARDAIVSDVKARARYRYMLGAAEAAGMSIVDYTRWRRSPAAPDDSTHPGHPSNQCRCGYRCYERAGCAPLCPCACEPLDLDSPDPLTPEEHDYIIGNANDW